MTYKSIAAALTLGFLACTLSILPITAQAEGNCPPGQTDTLKAYKGTCVDPKLIDPETGRLREASKCPPGQTDKLKAYKGICMPIEAGKVQGDTATGAQKPIKQIGKRKN